MELWARRTAMLVALLAGVLVTTAAAVQLRLDPRSIGEAIAIGQSRIERDRTRFHQPYRFVVGSPPVDTVEIVTPFRKIAMTAEARARIGDRTFGQRQALELLDAAPEEIEVWVEATFHPLNTFVGVPVYDVTLLDRTQRVPPRTFEVHPRYGPRVEGTPLPLPVPGAVAGPSGPSQPLLGGTVVARFDARLVDVQGRYEVVIEESGKELARVPVDLGRLR